MTDVKTLLEVARGGSPPPPPEHPARCKGCSRFEVDDIAPRHKYWCRLDDGVILNVTEKEGCQKERRERKGKETVPSLSDLVYPQEQESRIMQPGMLEDSEDDVLSEERGVEGREASASEGAAVEERLSGEETEGAEVLPLLDMQASG